MDKLSKYAAFMIILTSAREQMKAELEEYVESDEE